MPAPVVLGFGKMSGNGFETIDLFEVPTGLETAAQRQPSKG